MKAPLICSGLIVLEDRIVPGTVTIDRQSGLISNLSEGYNQNADIFGRDLVIAPGLIDIHTHFRECPAHDEAQERKENFETGEAAAINGGVVGVAPMPNLKTLPNTDARYDELCDLTRKRAITFVHYYAISPGSRPIKRNAPGKGFLAESIGELKFTSFPQAEDTLQHQVGRHVSLHCDSPDIIAAATGEFLHENRRPAASEIEGIKFALEMAAKYKFHLKVVHVSTAEGLRLIKEARRRGVSVTCEATPHHMFFDINMLTEENRPWLQMNPPLRTADDRVYIRNGLMFGDIEYLASDHAPHTKEENLKGISGVPHLDTLGHYVTWLVKVAGFDWPHAIKVASRNPGRWLSQFLPKDDHHGFGHGDLTTGHIGSLTIFNMGHPITIAEERLRTRCGWSPFTGMTFPGRVSHTIIRGEVLKGELKAA